MDEITITESGLRDMNYKVLPRTAAGFSRYPFWYYTKLSTVEKIISSECFYINSFANMNDLDEADLHWKKRGDVFALCFCNSHTEKIPMWYLYSGIDGSGAALGLSPASMLSFISSIETAFVAEGKFKGEVLKRGEDFDLQCGWVYYNPNNEPDRFLYRNKWYRVIKPSSFVENNYFLKRYSWEYEREFRIVFINKRKETFQRLAVPISAKTLSAFRLLLAPEINRKTVEETIAKYPKIHDHLYRNIEKSNLSINMNLLERNKQTIWNYTISEAEKCGGCDKAHELLNCLKKIKVNCCNYRCD